MPNASVIALIISGCSFFVAVSSLAVSFWNVYRDTPKLKITITVGSDPRSPQAISRWGGEPANPVNGLIVEVANIGRKPILMRYPVTMLLTRGEFELRHEAYYEGWPVDGRVIESSRFIAFISTPEWQKLREEQSLLRCISVRIVDASGKSYVKALPNSVESSFNGRFLRDYERSEKSLVK